jgi:hypothetical protein
MTDTTIAADAFYGWERLPHGRWTVVCAGATHAITYALLLERPPRGGDRMVLPKGEEPRVPRKFVRRC